MTETDPLDEVPFACLVGKSAVGKSELAVRLARRTGAELVSLDSMLVYRGMDVGTAKPSAELRAEVPHHVLDVVDPSERYDVSRWLADAREALRGIAARGGRALFVGGTAFFLQTLRRGLFEGPPVDLELRARIEDRLEERGAPELLRELTRVDPASAERVHPNDAKRLVRALEVFEQTGRPLSDWQDGWGWHGAEPRERAFPIVGLERPPDELAGRIEQRVEAMLGAGWVEEALAVRNGPGFGPTAIQALGYREVLAHADGRLDRVALVEKVTLRTRQFTRRQGTWFRKLPVRWVEAGAADVEDRLLAALEP